MLIAALFPPYVETPSTYHLIESAASKQILIRLMVTDHWSGWSGAAIVKDNLFFQCAWHPVPGSGKTNGGEIIFSHIIYFNSVADLDLNPDLVGYMFQ